MYDTFAIDAGGIIFFICYFLIGKYVHLNFFVIIIMKAFKVENKGNKLISMMEEMAAEDDMKAEEAAARAQKNKAITRKNSYKKHKDRFRDYHERLDNFVHHPLFENFILCSIIVSSLLLALNGPETP